MGLGKSKINTITKRRKLPVANKNPVCEAISKGRYLCYMKLTKGGVWRARLTTGKNRLFTDLGATEEREDDGRMTHEDALSAAVKWFDIVEGTTVGYMLNECVDDYVDKLKIRNTVDSSKRTKQRLYKHIPDDMMKTRVNKLTSAKISKWHLSMVKEDGDDEAKRQSKDSANRVLSQLKAALNYAYKLDIVSNPVWNKVDLFPGVSSGKVLLLTEKQLAAILNATTGGFHNLCKALVLTGARYGELNKATVGDFNKKEKTLHLVHYKGRSAIPHHRDAILSDNAVSFFEKLTKDRLPTAYLIVKDDGTPWGRSHQTRPWRNVVRKIAKNKKNAERVPEEAVPYDLRHYYISQLMMAGIPLKVIADNTGTSVAMIVKTYGKVTEEFKREAFNSVNIG